MSPHQTHHGIVVGVDGSPSSSLAVEWAARDADMRNVPIKLVHIVAPIAAGAEGWSDIPASSDYMQWRDDHARQLIEEAHKCAVEASSPSRVSQVTSEVRGGARPAGIGQLRPDAPCAVPRCRDPR